ncbi:hypothetical protein Tco_1184777 [Tanacetum coccineum]
MASTKASTSKPSKRPKINIIPPRQLFIDLTQDNTKTPSPKHQLSSPSAPNAPLKTPSTRVTSSSSIASKLKSPTSSTSLSTNGYLNSPISPPPRVTPPQENDPMDITLTLSPITPRDIQFNTPSPSMPSPPLFGYPISWKQLEAHGAICLCCIHNCTLIFGLRVSTKFEGVNFRRWQKKMHFLLSSMSMVYVLTTPILEDCENATVEQIRKSAKWDNDDYVCRGLILNDSDTPKGNNVVGPLVVNIVKYNNSTKYNDNKDKRKHHDNTRADPNKKAKLTCWKCGKLVALKGIAKVLMLATKLMVQAQKV